MDTRKLHQSKKGLGFLVGIAAIIIISITSLIYKQELADSINVIGMITSIYLTGQSAIDWRVNGNKI